MLDNEYVTLALLATSLRLPQKYLEGLAEQGRIPALRVAGRLRFKEQDVQNALRALAKPKTPRKTTILGGMR